MRHQLAYRDVVDPKAAMLKTAQWLVENPPALDGVEHMVLQDPFDYAAEDENRTTNYSVITAGPGGQRTL